MTTYFAIDRGANYDGHDIFVQIMSRHTTVLHHNCLERQGAENFNQLSSKSALPSPCCTDGSTTNNDPNVVSTSSSVSGMNELQGLSPLKLIPPPFHKFLPLNVQIRYSAINGTNTCMFSEKITKTVIIFNLISKNYIPCCYYKSGEKSLSERAFTFKLGMRPILRDRQDFFKEECKYKSALLFKSYKSGIF